MNKRIRRKKEKQFLKAHDLFMKGMLDAASDENSSIYKFFKQGIGDLDDRSPDWPVRPPSDIKNSIHVKYSYET